MAQDTQIQHISGSLFMVVQDGRPLIGVTRLQTRPGFKWPTDAADSLLANRRTSKDAVGAFLEFGRNAGVGEFRFALLGPKEVCLIARWHRRDAALQEVVCPASGGGYWDTSLSHAAPGPLAWCVVDLKGNGNSEVVSSGIGTGAYAAPPIYWYTVYSFRDGLPRDVSSEFPEFYRAAFLPQLSAIERMLNPPEDAQAPTPKWAPFESLVLRFMRLKYERRILGEKQAGLEEGLSWVKSPYIDVRSLGVQTLGEIPDPQSVAALREVGAKTKNLGICVAVTNALFTIGAITDAENTKRTEECDKLKPTKPCLLQAGCTAGRADQAK